MIRAKPVRPLRKPARRGPVELPEGSWIAGQSGVVRVEMPKSCVCGNPWNVALLGNDDDAEDGPKTAYLCMACAKARRWPNLSSEASAREDEPEPVRPPPITPAMPAEFVRRFRTEMERLKSEDGATLA